MTTDTLSGCDSTIDIAHAKVHSGVGFSITYAASVNSAANLDVLLITGASSESVHMQAVCSSSLQAQFFLYEGTTSSDNGTGLTVNNNFRISTKTCLLTAGHTPTVTGAGTALEQYSVGTAGGIITFGGTQIARNEWILKPSTKYLIRITSGAASNLCRTNVSFYLGGNNIA